MKEGSQTAEIFDTSTDNSSLNLRNIFADGEITEEATTEDFSVVRKTSATLSLLVAKFAAVQKETLNHLTMNMLAQEAP